MAIALTSGFKLSITYNYTNALDLSTPANNNTLNFSGTLTSGTGLNQANRMFEDTRSLASAADDDVDLSGALNDAFGSTLSLTKVRGIFIQNQSTTAGEILTVGAAGTNSFINWVADVSDAIKIYPGGVFFLWNPSATAYAVTAASGDLLRVHNSGSSTNSYKIVILGSQ